MTIICPMHPPTDWQRVRKDMEQYLSQEKDFCARLKTARSRLAQLKKAALAATVRSEWYTDPFYDLDPVYFMLAHHDEKPGRLLKKEPASKISAVRYGFDAQDRIVVVERGLGSQEFREYLPDRIDATRFDMHKTCRDIQSLILDQGRPVAYLSYYLDRLNISKFESKAGKIIGVLHASKQTWMTEPKWKFRKHTITEKKPGIFDITSDDEAYQPKDIYTHRYTAPSALRIKTPPPVLDLRKDLKELPPLIAAVAGRFAKTQTTKGKKPAPPVSTFGLAFVYYNNPTPRIYVNFDTRPGHLADGRWSHEHWQTIPRPTWQKFWEDHADAGTGFMIDARGKRHRISDDGDSDIEPATWFGEMLAKALQQARKHKSFKPLLQSADCGLSIDDNGDGAFAWND